MTIFLSAPIRSRAMATHRGICARRARASMVIRLPIDLSRIRGEARPLRELAL